MTDAHEHGPGPEASTIDPMTAPGRSPSAPLKQIGPYRIISTLGEGGMGTVYLAEQTEPVRRQVALKIIKLGMDTKSVVARFESERQALAMMDHPNVAKVFDAGSTDEGRPYFVMEHVSGVPITDHCDRLRLTVRERLAVFIDVCEAVQHAHQKGIIHRDLKPSNVLVSIEGERAMPKVIDFGVAKATAQKLTEKTLFTEQGQMVGTPEYMSPEQAEMTAQDIDTRSDVYSLGVLLYELLTGALPFDAKVLRAAGFAEIQRIVRDEEPPRPSTKLSSLGDASATHAKARKVEPGTLARALKGDLDWIVMKCLEKDRRRRYDTANGLALDIQRHLADEPVLAGPPSAKYRMSKFVRRNRTGVFAAAVVCAALVTATVVSISFALSEAAQRRIANENLDLADKRAEELEQVAEFQSEQLSGIDVQLMGVRLRRDLLDEARVAMERSKLETAEIEERTAKLEKLLAGTNFTNIALETLDENIFATALTAVDEQFAEQPLVRARLLQTLAGTLGEVGSLDAASPPQEEALEIRRRVLGEEHPDTLSSISNMGSLLRACGRLEDAEPYYLEALEARRRVLGDEHPDTLTSIGNMGVLLHERGRLEDAEPYSRESLDARRRVLGDEHPDTLLSINNMAFLLSSQGRLEDAEPYFRESLDARRRVLGDEHPSTLLSINNMGSLLWSQGRLEEAEPYWREALDARRRVLGDEHPDTLDSIINMGTLLKSRGRLEDADRYFREALDGYRRVLGDEHPRTLTSINNMGGLLMAQGRLKDAEPYYREALEGRRRVLGDEHPATLKSIGNMGGLLRARGRLEDAEPYYREALDAYRRVLGDEHPDTLASIGGMGRMLFAQGRLEDAEPYYREALEGRRRVLGDEHPSTLSAINNMGFLLKAQGRLEDAEPYYREALEGNRRVIGDEHPDTCASIKNMGALLNALRRYEAAEPLVRESLTTGEVLHGADDWRVAEARSLLGESLAGQERFEEAEPLLLQGYADLDAALPAGRRANKMPAATERVVQLYEAWHEAEPDAGHDAKAAEWRAKLEEVEQKKKVSGTFFGRARAPASRRMPTSDGPHSGPYDSRLSS